VLGIGGVRALTALRLAPTVWHMNEGHAAFLVLERTRMLVAGGIAVRKRARSRRSEHRVHDAHRRSGGHDHFAEVMVDEYFAGYCKDIGIERETLLALGREPGNGEFNMTALALRGSRISKRRVADQR
jgi:starch phosphorylase